MRSNLVVDRILQIQNEYKKLLSQSIRWFGSNTCHAAIDEITLFWLRNMDLVQLYLATEFANKDGYVLTGVDSLDYNNNEHYPFLLMGTQHILDDPLCKYSSTYGELPDGKNSEILFEQIVQTAKDNLEILENCNNHILILPFRFMSQTSNEASLYEMGEQLFIKLFNNIDSIDDYFDKCRAIEDILNYACEDFEDIVWLCANDDKSLPFKQRFNHAKANDTYMIDYKQNDAHIFFMMVIGYFIQAIDIIQSCIEYKSYPYIRSSVSIHYLLLVGNMLEEIPFVSQMQFKMCIANMVYRKCDKRRLSEAGFDKFIIATKAYDFSHKLFQELGEHELEKENSDISIIISVVERCLNHLYTFIGST